MSFLSLKIEYLREKHVRKHSRDPYSVTCHRKWNMETIKVHMRRYQVACNRGKDHKSIKKSKGRAKERFCGPSVIRSSSIKISSRDKYVYATEWDTKSHHMRWSQSSSMEQALRFLFPLRLGISWLWKVRRCSMRWSRRGKPMLPLRTQFSTGQSIGWGEWTLDSCRLTSAPRVNDLPHFWHSNEWVSLEEIMH